MTLQNRRSQLDEWFWTLEAGSGVLGAEPVRDVRARRILRADGRGFQPDKCVSASAWLVASGFRLTGLDTVRMIGRLKTHGVQPNAFKPETARRIPERDPWSAVRPQPLCSDG